jgi:hypothetical protein
VLIEEPTVRLECEYVTPTPVGAMLSGSGARYGYVGLLEILIVVCLKARLAVLALRARRHRSHGDSNDYVGKGLSGGCLV